MGDQNPFGSPFSSQPSLFSNTTQNVAASQDQMQASPSIFPSSDTTAGFGLFTNNAAASGTVRPDPAFSQTPSSNLFSNPGPKSLFATPAANSESSSSIFGGSAFSKSNESMFPSTVRQSMFGGNAAINSTQPSDVSGTSIFGRAPGSSGVKAAEVSSATGSIFGGSFPSSQGSTFKPNPINNLSSQTVESTSSSKPTIFGGAYSKREEPSADLGFSKATTNSDKATANFFSSGTSKVSFDGLASSAAETTSRFSSPKSAFGKFSNAGLVTSSLSSQPQEKLSNPFSLNAIDERKGEETERVSGWEPDSLEGSNQDQVSDQPKKSLRMNKLVRDKRGVFGKALDDVAKSSSHSEDMRSIMCHPLDGELGDISVLKDHFQQYGQPRVTVNKEKNFGVATYKTHEDAGKAMKGPQVIDGVKYKFFWRNMAKTRRKSVDDDDKQKTGEERKKIPKRSQMDMDEDVRAELAAISGIDYIMPQDASSKRKAVLDREVRKKTRSLGKPEGADSDGKEVQEDSYEPLKRNMKRTSRTEVSKDVKTRAPKLEEKSTLHSRIGKKIKDDSSETKTEKSDTNSKINSAITSAITTELRSALKQQATTSEEKLRLLDIRDKLIRHLQPKQYDISKAVKTVGTCPDMCPEKERLLRETRRQISQYEMSSTKASEMDPKLMVKQYSRSSADQEEPLPHDLRPPAVLTMTMNYLMHTIMNQGDEPGENLGEWYHFLWDRLRGIRKEITQQELSDMDAVSLVEQCARFHIHCGARLVAEDMSVFDDRINTENLTKCLQTLKHMYCDLWMNNSITCPNEPEFISYFLLLNLNNGTIMWEMEQLREEVLKSPEIGFVASMYNSLSSNNFIRFFRSVRKASYLNSCLCIRYFHQVRAKALKTYIKALAKIRPVNYPLGSLVEELGFENAEHAAAFCSHYGLQVDNASSDAACVILTHETFENPTFALPTEREFRLAESKKMGSVGEVVYGGPLPPRSYENHIVHESFDENGFLHKREFQLKNQIPTEMDREEEDQEEEAITEDINNQSSQMEAVNSSANDGDFDCVKNVPQPSAVPFSGFGNSKLVFSTPFTDSQPATSNNFNAPSNQMFKPSMNFLQVPSEKQDKFNMAQAPGMQDTAMRIALENLQAEKARAKMKAEQMAQAAELEKYINTHSDIYLQDLLESSVKEAATEIALSEWKAAEQQKQAEEKQRAMEQLRAQEELRKRILDAAIDRISNESLCDLFNEVVEQMVAQSAQEVLSSELELIESINMLSQEFVESLIYDVIEELCYDVAAKEKQIANECARQEAVKHRVRQVFYHWLEKARRSLHRRRVMQDFPASVIPLSIKEHAQRWSISKSDEVDAWESCSKGNEKVLDIPELKAMPAYPQITFAELIAIQAVHRYDTVRVKLGLHPTDKLLYKLFVSVPEEPKDPAGQLVDWWIRRSLKQNCGMICDDVEKGVYRIVSGVKVTSEVAVYASLQMVRGNNLLGKQTSLASGTSAILFGLSPSSNIEESRSRLTTLLKSIAKLPAVPLVVAVVSPLEPPLEGLKQLVALLELDQWLHHGAISDYQILHVEEQFDLKYLSQRFNMSFNYMVMTWTPIPEFALVCLKNVLRSTFQMFFISIQFNYNSSEIYPQDIDDPRVIIGLCNEWLDHMCHEFVSSYHDAKDLCGEEFWPLLHKGAYLPFLNKPKYELLLREVIRTVALPAMEWPPSSEEEFESILSQYCSWLRPDDQKQTSRRLSCLNGLTWSEKIRNIPWVNLVEDWMEARINYIETSVICGTELLCLMRAQNVERLYTYPWWAQSQHILSYIEANGSGRECEMDVDQTVPIECSSLEDCNLSPVKQKQECSGLQNLKEVTECVSELKKVNESLVSRLCSALEDGATATSESIINCLNVSAKAPEANTQAAPSNLESLVKNVDFQVKVHRNLRSSLNSMLSRALAEEGGDAIKESASAPLINTNNSVESPKRKPASDPVKAESSKKMDEIMSSVNDIMSSLNQKYKILDDVSTSSKISDLKLGLAKVDCSPSLSENLHRSSYVQESEKRMMERLRGSSWKKSSKSHEKYQASTADSDLEVMSDDKSVSSPSYVESETEKSVSDPEENESDGHSYDSDYEENVRSKKRSHSNDSDDESYSGSRIRRHHSDSDNYSGDRYHRRNNRDQDHSSQDVRGYQDDSEDNNSDRSSQESEREPSDDEEIQTITSDDSREAPANRQPVNLPESSASHCDDDPLLEEVVQPVSDSYIVEAESIAENGLVIEDAGSHLTNLDNPHDGYQSYYVEGTELGVEDPVFTVSAEMGILNSGASLVVPSSDLVSEDNDDVLLTQYKRGCESEEERVYEIVENQHLSEFVPDPIEDTHQSTSDESDHYENDQRYRVVSEGSSKNIDESGSEVEEYENLEEEECDDGEAEVEGDEECMDEELVEEGEEEEEVETEPETEAEPEDDSDVCEVIDD